MHLEIKVQINFPESWFSFFILALLSLSLKMNFAYNYGLRFYLAWGGSRDNTKLKDSHWHLLLCSDSRITKQKIKSLILQVTAVAAAVGVVVTVAAVMTLILLVMIQMMKTKLQRKLLSRRKNPIVTVMTVTRVPSLAGHLAVISPLKFYILLLQFFSDNFRFFHDYMILG